MVKSVYILNGPNLNALGTREPDVYGTATLDDVKQASERRAKSQGLAVDFRQTNHEGELIDWIHAARDGADGIILNAGALTHTSLALFDALKAAQRPVIEVHLSNIFARESFRHQSYVAPAAVGIICGFGVHGYELAIDAMAQHLAARTD